MYPSATALGIDGNDDTAMQCRDSAPPVLVLVMALVMVPVLVLHRSCLQRIQETQTPCIHALSAPCCAPRAIHRMLCTTCCAYLPFASDADHRLPLSMCLLKLVRSVSGSIGVVHAPGLITITFIVVSVPPRILLPVVPVVLWLWFANGGRHENSWRNAVASPIDYQVIVDDVIECECCFITHP